MFLFSVLSSELEPPDKCVKKEFMVSSTSTLNSGSVVVDSDGDGSAGSDVRDLVCQVRSRFSVV